MNKPICVNYSGGLMSWAAAKLACDKYGAENMVLLFADTGIEDEDLYVFLEQGAAAIGATLIKLHSDKFQDPLQVAEHYRFLPANNAPVCSSHLKRDVLDKWQRENCTTDTLFVLGFSYDEPNRIEAMRRRQPNKRFWFPLADKPYSMCEINGWLFDYGLEWPRLYKMGFLHNNCGGFCFQGGHGHFAMLLKELPYRFYHYAEWEKRFREKHKIERTILRKKVNGVRVPYSLYDLARDYHTGSIPVKDMQDIYVNCACSEMWTQTEFNFEKQ